MKFIAYFLPQFYPTPENDKYWGKGFTDWINVNSAKPLFAGHKQPIIPGELGYYDLSDINVLRKQSTLSLENRIDGFGYWHYWFGNGFQTLEKVPEMHLSDPSIKQNFFFAWANLDWTKSWIGDDNTFIFKQVYSERSAEDHFNYIKSFLSDSRYIRLNGRPIFQVINPGDKGVKEHIRILEKRAISCFGIGFHWIFPIHANMDGLEDLCYSRVGYPPGDVTKHNLVFKIRRNIQKRGYINSPVVISESAYIEAFKVATNKALKKKVSYFPCVLSGWDNTIRYKNKGFLIDGEIISLLTKQFDVINKIYTNRDKPEIIFIKAWNEWAEGNILEPFSFNGDYKFPLKVITDIKM